MPACFNNCLDLW